MTIQPTALNLPSPGIADSAQHSRRVARRRRVRLIVMRAAAVLFALQLVGSSAVLWNDLVDMQMTHATAGSRFNLLRWEIGALQAKGSAFFKNPASGLSAEAGSALVRDYLRNARLLGRLDSRAEALRALGTRPAQMRTEMILAKADALRATQAQRRPAAEAVIQAQVTQILKQAGFGAAGGIWPPVLFAFADSPKQLVVSPRTRIVSGYARTLDPNMSLDAKERTEAQVEASGLWSAFVTETGGMGAFPTMVMPEASLAWVLSTVAHEWVHTYLAFFPLGFNYGITAENRIINETTADIVGDEIGRRVLETYYPELLPPPARDDTPPVLDAGSMASAFDFRAAMAETRAVADRLLHFGRVKDAEQYMELRRQYFVENGYALRKLNQAWFAFHGSYGTGAAADVRSPDALAPKVVQLRTLTGSPHAFLQTIRSITDAAGLERLLQSAAYPKHVASN